MRCIALCFVTISSLLFTACGDDSNAFAFKSMAKPPQGAPVKIAYDFKVGEGVRMKMSMNGTMSMSGDVDMDTPLDMTLGMLLTCDEITASGDAVFSMVFEGAKISGLDNALTKAGMHGVKGRMTIGADGKLKGMSMDGLDPAMEKQVSQLLNNPGFQSFVSIPPEGMRIGEAIDLAKVMPAESFAKLLEMAAPGTNLKPKLEGEIVLLGTTEIDGTPCAEFGVNMVMNLTGTMSQGSNGIEMDMGMKVQGTQFTSLVNGLPLGTATMTMAMRMSASGGGSDVEMEMKADMTITCERLR